MKPVHSINTVFFKIHFNIILPYMLSPSSLLMPFFDDHTSIWFRVKSKVPVTGPVVSQRVGRGIALLSHDRGTRRREWSAARPGRT